MATLINIMKIMTLMQFVVVLITSGITTMSTAQTIFNSQANIQLQHKQNSVIVSPCLASAPQQKLRYEISALRVSKNGSSRSKQSGYFNPGVNLCPSELKLSYQFGDKAFFVLRVYDHQSLLTEVTLDYPAAQ